MMWASLDAKAAGNFAICAELAAYRGFALALWKQAVSAGVFTHTKVPNDGNHAVEQREGRISHAARKVRAICRWSSARGFG